MSSCNDNTWVAVDGGNWHFAAWDDEPGEVFYDAGSGNTLLINRLGAGILRRLADSPRRESDLAVHLMGEAMTEAQHQDLRLTLQFLWQSRLIRPQAT